MLYILLSIEYTDFIIPAILGLVIWFYLIRTAVRADSITKNQQLILHTLVQIYKKHGATDEEMKSLQEEFNK
jgi:TRAP-type uncharacterized transport system fused permease subunit